MIVPKKCGNRRFYEKKRLTRNYFFKKEYFDVLFSATLYLILCLSGSFPSNLRKLKFSSAVYN